MRINALDNGSRAIKTCAESNRPEQIVNATRATFGEQVDKSISWSTTPPSSSANPSPRKHGGGLRRHPRPKRPRPVPDDTGPPGESSIIGSLARSAWPGSASTRQPKGAVVRADEIPGGGVGAPPGHAVNLRQPGRGDDRRGGHAAGRVHRDATKSTDSDGEFDRDRSTISPRL